MVYKIEPLDLMALLAPVVAATATLARLDERLARSPVRDGWIERQHFAGKIERVARAQRRTEAFFQLAEHHTAAPASELFHLQFSSFDDDADILPVARDDRGVAAPSADNRCRCGRRARRSNASV